MPGQGGVTGHHASKAVNGQRAVRCSRTTCRDVSCRSGQGHQPLGSAAFHVIGQLVNGMHRLEYLYALVLDENAIFALVVVNGSNLCLALSKRT